MQSQVYELYGLRVWSQVELAAPPARSALPPYDVAVHWGERTARAEGPAAGRVLATFAFGNGQGYTLTDTGTYYILRIHHTCEFCIDHDLRTVRVHLASGSAPAMAALLLAGTVLACLLTLAGEGGLVDKKRIIPRGHGGVAARLQVSQVAQLGPTGGNVR